jgi:hypothetical protein
MSEPSFRAFGHSILVPPLINFHLANAPATNDVRGIKNAFNRSTVRNKFNAIAASELILAGAVDDDDETFYNVISSI